MINEYTADEDIRHGYLIAISDILRMFGFEVKETTKEIVEYETARKVPERENSNEDCF